MTSIALPGWRTWSYPALRGTWPAGPWTGEPDKALWRDAATGLPCQVSRALDLLGGGNGHLCGYVVIPSMHPLFGRRLPDLDLQQLPVYGGITYSEAVEADPEGDGSFDDGSSPYLDAFGDPSVIGSWMLGFDFGHGNDMRPGWPRTLRNGFVYRTFAQAVAETTRLAAVLAQLGRSLER